MAYLIVRIEPRENDTRPNRDALPVVAHLAKGNVKNGANHPREYKALAEKHGFTFPSHFGQHPIEEWPYIAYCYVSPNRDGKGRGRDQLMRRLCKSCGEQR